VKVAYRQGLHELGDGLFAYLQPDGTWGWSNAGLITGGGSSLLIDTLFDLKLTRAMLEAMAPITASDPIERAMNTHGNGDHWFGNEALADGIPIIATAGALADMEAVPPSTLQALVTATGLPPGLDAFLDRSFRRFDFAGMRGRPATETFAGDAELRVGDREVRLIELGPAHTPGDAIAHVPDAGVVFTGDLLFVEGTPIVWAGPVANWLAACDAISALGARVLVPGHGPVTDESGIADLKRYLTYVRDQAQARFDAGMDAEAAADDIDIADFRDWGDPERIVVNVAAVYRELDPSLAEASPPELFERMGRWTARHA